MRGNGWKVIHFSEWFGVIVVVCVLQERILLRTFMAFEGEIASAMSVSTCHMFCVSFALTSCTMYTASIVTSQCANSYRGFGLPIAQGHLQDVWK